MEKRVLFHVPHDGNCFPEELQRSVCVPREIFLRYHRQMRDFGVRSFIPQSDTYHSCIFEISRLLCDVERFVGEKEPMEAFGMGFCYERVYDGTRIKQVDEALREKTLAYYKLHHERLDSEALGFRGKLVLFDLHSFSRQILVGKVRVDCRPLPDICIGGDEYLPKAKADAVIRAFQAAGYSVAVNDPYSGSMVPNAVLSGRADLDLLSCMAEVNKRVYLTPEGRPIPAAVRRIRAVLAALAEAL